MSLPVSLPLKFVRSQSQTESALDNIFDKICGTTRSKMRWTTNERQEVSDKLPVRGIASSDNKGDKIDKLADTITSMSSSISDGFDSMTS